MIKHINIKNFAIIKDLSIDFDKSFNVFTGETGAGKSIIIAAINLLSGARGDLSLIAKGEDKAIIEGIFTISNHMKEILLEADIDFDDELIIYRKIATNGQIRVNDRLVTASFLQKLFDEEIDIHSQKETWFLLKPTNQLKVIDRLIEDETLFIELRKAYDDYLSKSQALDKFNKQFEEGFDIAYLRFQYDELDKAKLDINEESELLNKERLIKNSANNLKCLNDILEHYYQNNGISESLYYIINNFNIDDENVNHYVSTLKEYYYEMEDIFENIAKIKDSYCFDENEIDNINERLFVYNSLKRKYHKNTEDLIHFKEDLAKDIDNYDNSTQRRKELEDAKEKAFVNYQDKALKLSKARQAQALLFEKQIINEVSSLNLPYFDFKILFTTKDIGIDGIDSISFHIKTNQNQDLRPINKIASGGEMSRILLAIKVVLSRILDLSLIIFDEIDTGISGLAAKSVGKKMKELSKHTQLITISHLAQIAMYANSHFEVSKDNNNSFIKSLDDKGRIEALAMMSSSSKSESALALAKEMLKEAHE